MKRAAFLVVLAACTRHEEQPNSSVAALPSVTAAATATVVSAPVVDAGPITACTATFTCGMSHPGMGSYSRSTSVDLGACTRSSVSDSGPYDPTSPRNPPKPTVTKVAQADCDRLRDLASALGPADQAAMESAHMDSEACSLTVSCAGAATNRFYVQRQTTTGPTLVERTIRVVLGGVP